MDTSHFDTRVRGSKPPPRRVPPRQSGTLMERQLRSSQMLTPCALPVRSVVARPLPSRSLQRRTQPSRPLPPRLPVRSHISGRPSAINSDKFVDIAAGALFEIVMSNDMETLIDLSSVSPILKDFLSLQGNLRILEDKYNLPHSSSFNQLAEYSRMSPDALLISAIEDRDVEFVESLMKHSDDLETTVLVQAVSAGNLKLVGAILEGLKRFPYLSHINDIEEAILTASYEDRPGILGMLFEYHNDERILNSTLAKAAYSGQDDIIEVLQETIDDHPEYNIMYDDAFIGAFINGHYETADDLFVLLWDRNGFIPGLFDHSIRVAVDDGNLRAVKYVINLLGTEVEGEHFNFTPIIDIAADGGHKDIVQYLFGITVQNMHNSALSRAVNRDNLEAVETMLEIGVADNLDDALQAAYRKRNTEMADMLRDFGAR